MKIKLSDTTPIQINWLVAKCEGWEPGKYMMSPDIRKDADGKLIGIMVPNNREYVWFKPSTDWAQSGPIIEREKISLRHDYWENGGCRAFIDRGGSAKNIIAPMYGPTSLIAAMRCYVASRIGDEVEVPEELC